ncbi:MAG TPA: hypothetical protein VIR28_13770 [Achromobacter sp.]|uniref:hypothetical protein n=1 Tax=Achromobacter sp. TaxID=134375 RepID=UPI002F922076
MTNVEIKRLSTPGREVIIINPKHPMYDAIGVTAGLADTIGTPRIRVVIGEGEIYLCDPADLAEN